MTRTTAVLIGDHLGRSRAIVRRDGNRFVMHQLSPMGGIVLPAYLMAWGPMLSPQMGDRTTRVLAKKIAERRLADVWPALQRFERRENRWPRDLAELFRAEGLADDALSVPGDPEAEEMELTGGRRVPVAFRYFPDSVAVPDRRRTVTAKLVGFDSWSGRLCLDERGEIMTVFGEGAAMPIDRLGK